MKVGSMSVNAGAPTVEEVLRFEDLAVGSLASRRAIVCWSDGSEGEAIRFYADESLGVRGGPGRQDPGRDQVAALPPRPRLAPVLAPPVGAINHSGRAMSGRNAGSAGRATRSRDWRRPIGRAPSGRASTP